MKFIQKLNLLVEGIGSSRNIYRLLPSFIVHKDKKFLRMTDFLYGLKKLIQYVNEEIEDYNKKAKVKIPSYKLNISHKNSLVKKEIMEIILNFIDFNLNRDLFKKQLIKTLIKLFKDQDEYSDFYKFCEENIKDVTVSITSTDNKHFMDKILVSHPDVSHKSFIHDFVMHTFLNPKDIQKFDIKDIDGYDFISSHRFSPGSILNELVALQTDLFKHYSFLISDFVKSIRNDFKNFVEKSKIDDFNIEEQDFINKIFNQVFTLKNKILLQKLENVLLNNKDEDFNFDEIKTIDILLKNSPYKEYFKLTSEYYIDKIISNQRISNLNDKKEKIKDHKGNIIEQDKSPFYEFIERVIQSIVFRKNKFSKDKNQTVNWKDFRTYFRDYPYVLKLFPKSKYPDNKVIFDHRNLKYDLMDLLPEEKPELIKINRIIINAVNVGQVLSKKSKTGVFDIENKEDKIDFVIERFSKLLKNQFNDNSKYYTIIDKELKSL